MSCFCCYSTPRHRPRSRSLSPSPFSLKSKSPSVTSHHHRPLHHLAHIFEDLKCPICFNLCVPPIHNCVNGHIICNSCRLRGAVTTCPTCRSSLTTSSMGRNLFAETFIQNYTQRCRYSSQGCEHLQLKGQSMKPHEGHCMFRPIRCLLPNCRHKIPYQSYLGHMLSVHHCMGTNYLPASVKFTYKPSKKTPNSGTTSWSPFVIQAFENVYYVMMHRLGPSYWFWVYLQSSREGDSCEHEYTALIKLRHPDRRMSLSWHGPVYSLRTSFKIIKTEACALSVPHHLLRSFAGNEVLRLTVDIRQKAKVSLNGVTIPGEGDSDTAVMSEQLPSEYQRPPRFYTGPTVTMEQAGEAHQGQGQGDDGHHVAEGLTILDPNGNPVLLPKEETEEVTPRTPRKRMPAIGIPSGFQCPSQETSVLDMTRPPAEIFGGMTSSSNDDEGDGDDDIFNDKVVAYLSMTVPRS